MFWPECLTLGRPLSNRTPPPPPPPPPVKQNSILLLSTLHYDIIRWNQVNCRWVLSFMKVITKYKGLPFSMFSRSTDILSSCTVEPKSKMVKCLYPKDIVSAFPPKYMTYSTTPPGFGCENYTTKKHSLSQYLHGQESRKKLYWTNLQFLLNKSLF